MSLIITKGYLIKRQDYNVFDEIITLVNEHGLKFTCFSQGSRRIQSKNARNLNYGDYIEFIFFYSENKMSRLKTATTLSTLDEKYKLSWSLSLINEIYCQIPIENKLYFDFYQKIIFWIINSINDYLLMFYICIRFLKINLKKILCEKCYQQHKNYTLDLQEHAFIGLECYHLKSFNFETQIMIDIFNNENSDLNEIKDYDLKMLTLLLKQLIFFINKKLNLTLSSKWL